MKKTILEILEEHILEDGYYGNDFDIDDHLEYEYDDNYIGRGVIEVEDDYMINYVDKYIADLSLQYKKYKNFDKETLKRFGYGISGDLSWIVQAFIHVIKSDKYDKDIVLKIGKTLLESTDSVIEVSTGLFILAQVDFEDVLKVIPNIDEVLKLLHNYSWLKMEVITAYYCWGKYELLYEKLETKDNLPPALIPFVLMTFKPLDPKVGLTIINDFNLHRYNSIFWMYIDIEYYLNDFYSKELLINTLKNISPVVRGSRIKTAEKDKINAISDLVVEKIMTEDFDNDEYAYVYNFYKRLKRNRNKLARKIDEKFKGDLLFNNYKEEIKDENYN